MIPVFARMRQFAPLLLVLLCAVVVVAVYLQAINYPFVSDDEFYITANNKLAGLHLTELWRLFTEPYNPFSEFLPLRDLSYRFDMTLFGLNPSMFRAHNIFLYLLCLPLVYGTTLSLWRYFRPADAASAQWAAAAVTVLFTVHPSHVEAVVWIAGRKDLLSGMFSLLALWLAVRVKREQKLSAPYAAATLVALLAAMLSKATAVAVAPVIAILWIIFWRDIPAPDRRRSFLLWPFASLLLAVGIALVFAAIITTRIPLYFGIEAATRSLAVLGWLARLAVSPESRHFFYPVLEDPYLFVMVTLGVAVLVSTVLGGVMILRRRSLAGFALLTFLLLCAPSLQLIPYVPPSLASDRFVFLAVWPAILLVVAASWRLKPVPRAAILLIIALAWGFQTTERTRNWHSWEAVIDTDLRAYPGHYLPAFQKITWIQLRQWLYRDAGETAGNISDADIRNITTKLIQATYAVRIKAEKSGKPNEAMAHLHNLEVLLKHPPVQTKWNSPMLYVWNYCQYIFLLQWKHLSEQFPDDASVRYNAGLSLLNFNEYEGAAAHFRAAFRSQHFPESMRGTAFKNLGLALLNSGHVAEAEAPLRAALEQTQPDLQAHCLLSEVYKQTKRIEESAHAEAECLKQTPSGVIAP